MSSRGSLAGGLLLGAVGGLVLGLGLLRSPLLPPGAPGLSLHAMASGVGFLLVVAGVLLAALTFRHAPEPAPVVPAHVAFMTRTPRPIAAPERVAVAPRRAEPAPAASEERARMQRLDGEIRELTRQISKAGVLLATGQISRQGYAAYVADLKQKRGDLEATRVRLELRRG